VAAEELGEHEQRGRGDHDPGDPPEDLICPLLQLGTDQAEPLRVRLEPDRVRVPADRGGTCATAPGDDEAARHQVITSLLGHRLGLAGQQRLIQLQPVGLQHAGIHRDLVAASQLKDVVQHDLVRIDLRCRAVAHHARPRGGQDREAIQRALGMQLLGHPDSRIHHQHHTEQPVLRRPDDQDHHEQRAEDRVEPGQHIGTQDLQHGATRRGRSHIDLAGGYPLPDLLRRQARHGHPQSTSPEPVPLVAMFSLSVTEPATEDLSP
jgi:hypothetical protein